MKHVELIGIINKLLLFHLVGVYIIYINDARSNKCQNRFYNEFITTAVCNENCNDPKIHGIKQQT